MPPTDIERDLNISPKYAGIVKRCRADKENFLISNGDINHARYVIYHLIKNAKSEIRIFSGNMHEAVYGNNYVREALSKASEKGIKITIIVEKKDDNSEVSFFKKNSSINVYQLRKEVLDFIKKDDSITHFLLSDKISFRIEDPHKADAFEKNKISADVNFNNKEWCVKFGKTFSGLLEHSIAISGC